jgi:hypothetical protein
MKAYIFLTAGHFDHQPACLPFLLQPPSLAPPQGAAQHARRARKAILDGISDYQTYRNLAIYTIFRAFSPRLPRTSVSSAPFAPRRRGHPCAVLILLLQTVRWLGWLSAGKLKPIPCSAYLWSPCAPRCVLPGPCQFPLLRYNPANFEFDRIPWRVA